MTGKKRQRYDHMPRYESEVFDLQIQFVGDFSGGPPVGFELEGSREKKTFVVRHSLGDKLRGAFLCNRTEEEAAEIEKTIRAQSRQGVRPRNCSRIDVECPAIGTRVGGARRIFLVCRSGNVLAYGRSPSG